jgi:hypothetical protein
MACGRGPATLERVAVSRRHPLLCAAAVLGVCLGFPAPAAAIVHGEQILENGVYPAQGVLRINTDDVEGFEAFCGGTLIGSRQFLTSARCTRDDFGAELPKENFLVQLGNVDRSSDTPDDYLVSTITDAPGFVWASRKNDAAVLTLDHVANYEPMRVVDANENALWAPGTLARILGWGRTSTSGVRSQMLRQADVPIIDDARCAAAHGSAFDPAAMVCAADAPGTPLSAAHDSCADDWGGPLLVPDGGFFALAGIISWQGSVCGDPDQPGVYTRLGQGALNTWVHGRTPEANFEFTDHGPRANEPVTLTSTSKHPEDAPGAGYFTTFRWDLDGDNDFDASGKSVRTTFPTEGEQVVGIEASRPGGDKATAYFAFSVGPDPNAPPSDGGPGSQALTTTPPAAVAKPSAPPARITSAKRPKVRRGRFRIRVRFARNAPRGIAVVEVYRGKRKIGVARGRVRRGGSRKMTVKLTPAGRRMLRRSTARRLKVRVRVRVGRRVLRSKALSIRR